MARLENSSHKNFSTLRRVWASFDERKKLPKFSRFFISRLWKLKQAGPGNNFILMRHWCSLIMVYWVSSAIALTRNSIHPLLNSLSSSRSFMKEWKSSNVTCEDFGVGSGWSKVKWKFRVSILKLKFYWHKNFHLMTNLARREPLEISVSWISNNFLLHPTNYVICSLLNGVWHSLLEWRWRWSKKKKMK